MKRKEIYSIKNKIVNVEQVLDRGERVPLLELEFKQSGFNRIGGHKVYIDYKCALELQKKIVSHIDAIQSKYFASEYYNRIHNKPTEQLFI